MTLIAAAMLSGFVHAEDANKGIQLIGEQLCLPEKSHIILTNKEFGGFPDFYVQKYLSGSLTETQLVCDLGTPHEENSHGTEFNSHQLPMENGDRFLRWGEYFTNNSDDDFSIIVVVNPKGAVSSMIKYDVSEKKMLKVIKTDENIKVARGSYSAKRTVVVK